MRLLLFSCYYCCLDKPFECNRRHLRSLITFVLSFWIWVLFSLYLFRCSCFETILSFTTISQNYSKMYFTTIFYYSIFLLLKGCCCFGLNSYFMRPNWLWSRFTLLHWSRPVWSCRATYWSPWMGISLCQLLKIWALKVICLRSRTQLEKPVLSYGKDCRDLHRWWWRPWVQFRQFFFWLYPSFSPCRSWCFADSAVRCYRGSRSGNCWCLIWWPSPGRCGSRFRNSTSK